MAEEGGDIADQANRETERVGACAQDSAVTQGHSNQVRHRLSMYE